MLFLVGFQAEDPAAVGVGVEDEFDVAGVEPEIAVRGAEPLALPVVEVAVVTDAPHRAVHVTERGVVGVAAKCVRRAE